MNEDYLWDRSGPADPEVARLELTLAALRLREAEPAPVTRPAWSHASSMPSHRARRGTTLLSAMLAAAATAALIWAWVGITTPTDDAQVHEQAAAAVVHTDPIAVGQPAPPSSPGLGFGPAPASDPPPEHAATRSDVAPPRASARARAQKAPIPDSLTATQIKEGLAVPMPEAKACGPRHGAASGERVTIKLSIAGATGAVTSSNALGRHANTPLGECVAAALRKATFPTFSRASIGVQYPVTME